MNVAWAPLGEMSLLRIYALAGDRARGKSLSHSLVEAARAAGLKGATALPGLMGFGRHGFDTELMTLLYDPLRQPELIEIVDETERLEAFLPTVNDLNRAGRLVTLERLEVYSYHLGSGA